MTAIKKWEGRRHQEAQYEQKYNMADKETNEQTKFSFVAEGVTRQNSIPEEIKSRLRSGNACYHSVQNLLSSRLLSTNLKIKIYRTVILPLVLCGCETWSLTLR